jgi:acyl dehydratase
MLDFELRRSVPSRCGDGDGTNTGGLPHTPDLRAPACRTQGIAVISTPFEDTVIGTRATSAARTIDEADVRSFAELTWDRHPLHVDPAYAERTRFGAQIAHGALMVSTLLGLVDLDPRYVQCFYGVEQLRFRAPTYLGDTVHVVSEVVAVRPRPDGDSGVVTCEGTLVNQDDKTVLVGQFSFLVAGRATAMTLEVTPR